MVKRVLKYISIVLFYLALIAAIFVSFGLIATSIVDASSGGRPAWVVPMISIGVSVVVLSVLFVVMRKIVKFVDENQGIADEDRMPVNKKYRIITIVQIVAFVLLLAALAGICAAAFLPVQGNNGHTSYLGITLAASAVISVTILYFAIVSMIKGTLREHEKRLPTRARVVTITVSLSLAVIIFLVSLLVCAQNTALFYPNGKGYSSEHLANNADCTQMTLQCGTDNYSGWLYAPYGDDAPTLLYFGGNAENSISKVSRTIPDDDLDYIYKGYNFLHIDYPGYGDSKGYPNQGSICKMALDVYDALPTIDGVNSANVMVMGFSIGTGFATYLASERDVGGLILLAPYNNGTDLLNTYFNVFHGPLTLAVNNRLTSDEYAEKVEVKPFIAASKADSVVKHTLTEKLIPYFPRGATLISSNNVQIGHNNLQSDQSIVSGITAYLDEYLQAV